MRKPGRTTTFVIVATALILGSLLAPPLSAGGDVTISYRFLPPGPNYTQADATAFIEMALVGAGTFPRTDIDWKGPQGETVMCRPVGGGCTIRNVYSANGSLIGATHEFWIAGQGRTPGTYTAVGKYCYPDPYTRVCYGWTELFRLTFNISAAGMRHTISGNAGLGGAVLAYDDEGARTATADAGGAYTFTVPAGWTGTVTPAKPGYLFVPRSRTYTEVEASAPGQNYQAKAVASRNRLPQVLNASTAPTYTLSSAAPARLPALRLR